MGVSQSAPELLAAAARIADERQTVGARLASVVDEGDGTHQRTHDQLGVVVEEVDLNTPRDITDHSQCNCS